MAIPEGKQLLVCLERDAAEGDPVYARMALHIRDALGQQFPGVAVVENKFRSPSIYTTAVGNVISETDEALEMAGFPRAHSFEVSFICYGPGDTMLVPTTIHSKLER